MASNDNIIEVNQESEITENTVDACSDAGISSKDIKTEEGQESENTEELTEKTIEANFKTHKSYLEKHIDVSDLIGYYELFTQEEGRKLHQENFLNREAAARSALSIIEEQTQSDKYTQLLFALDTADCPKLVDLLKGKLVPRNKVNRQRINKARRHICERLTPSNVLHYLVSWGVITRDESEKITKKERNESRLHAALDLLFILPNRSKDWYTLFLKALVYGDEHTQLAELIDHRKAEQIKAQRLAGMKTDISDSDISLEKPVQEKIVRPSYERLIGTTDKRLVVTTDDTSEHRTSSGPKDLFCDLCYDDTGDMIQAYGFCYECNIFICKSCHARHRGWPILQKHIIVQGGEMPNPQAYKPIKYIHCTLHSGGVKDHYCVEHDEFICSKCIKQMHQNCNTSSLSETASIMNIIAVKHFVSVVDNLKNDGSLAKSKFEHFVSDIENQKEDLIKQANEERDKIISRAEKLCKNTVSMIPEICEQKKAYITEKVMALENIIHSLHETNTVIKRKLNVKFEQNVIIWIQQIVENVREYRSEIENMNKQIRKISLSFSPSPAVSTFLSVSKCLGDVRDYSQKNDLSEINVSKVSSLDIRLKKDKETCHTEGIAVTSKDVLLISDWKHESVKAFSQDNKLLSCLTFSHYTYGISVIDDQTAAVSTYDKKLHILNICDPANISIRKSLSLLDKAFGITHYKGNLIVTKFDEPQCVKMIDLNGKEKWSISVDHKGQQLFANPHSVIVSTCNDISTAVVSDWGKKNTDSH